MLSGSQRFGKMLREAIYRVFRFGRSVFSRQSVVRPQGTHREAASGLSPSACPHRPDIIVTMNTATRPEQAFTYVNIAAYKFVKLTNLQDRRERLRDYCRSRDLKGTILLSPEGINLFIAGTRQEIDSLIAELAADAEIGPMEYKESLSDHQPFSRMLVKLKQEIIAFGVDGISPADHTSPKLPATELKRWLDEGQSVTLLDVRNDYEVSLGTFAGAEAIGVDHFRDFPDAAQRWRPEHKQQPVVMFCTGGIRCEKAGPYMERIGFENIYQLEGGILKYFEECGQEHFDGECFVFDKRVALDGQLRETDTALCFACQRTLSAEEQLSPDYVPGESCPYCVSEE